MKSGVVYFRVVAILLVVFGIIAQLAAVEEIAWEKYDEC